VIRLKNGSAHFPELIEGAKAFCQDLFARTEAIDFGTVARSLVKPW
jgi:hypothetical protein